MANHDLIVGRNHTTALRQNQQILGHNRNLGTHDHHLGSAQAHEHHLDMGDNRDDLGLDHPHDHELGLEQDQDHEGDDGHSYRHENELGMDRKPDLDDHGLSIPPQNHDLVLVENNELAVSDDQELEGSMELAMDQHHEMGIESMHDMSIQDSQLALSPNPVLQARMAVANPHYELVVGQEFPDVKSCRRALRDTAIALHFEMQTIKSDKTRFTAKCASEGCPWRIHAAKLPGVPTFTIRTIHKTHTCGGIYHLGHQQASVQWVANSVEQRLRDPDTYFSNVSYQARGGADKRLRNHKLMPEMI